MTCRPKWNFRGWLGHHRPCPSRNLASQRCANDPTEVRGSMKEAVADHWPAFRLARELAGKVFPVSEAIVLQIARKHGIGRKMGRAIIFCESDCQKLYEVLPCPSNWSGDRTRQTGSSAAPSAESALKKALALVTVPPRRKSAPSERPKSSRHQSTVVQLQPASPKPR